MEGEIQSPDLHVYIGIKDETFVHTLEHSSIHEPYLPFPKEWVACIAVHLGGQYMHEFNIQSLMNKWSLLRNPTLDVKDLGNLNAVSNLPFLEVLK